MHIHEIATNGRLIIEAEQGQYELFVDLDGVVADFESGVEKALKTVFGQEMEHSEERFENDPKYRNMMWKATKDYQDKHGGQLWHELPLLNDARQLWDYIKQYEPQILTATGDPKHNAEPQKRKWVAEKFGSNVPVNTVRKAAEKQQYAADNHILIDDKEKAIQPWRQAGGIGILHTSADSTIKQLKKLGL